MKKKEAGLKVGGIASTEKFTFRVAERRGSIYDPVFAQMAKLKTGQSFIVPIPKGVDVKTMHNRMNAAINRGPVKPPEGCVFRKRTTLDGEIAVCCLKNGERVTTEKPLAKAKSKKVVKPKAKAKKSKARKAARHKANPVSAQVAGTPETLAS